MSSRKRHKSADNLKKTSSPSPTPSPTPSPLKYEPKYIFIGFFIHGAYATMGITEKLEPYHGAKSLRAFKSTPKLMTFTNSSPGNIVWGNADGSDNTKIKKYFETNSHVNFLTDANDQEEIIAENFLNYSKNALATLPTNPRDDLEKDRDALTKKGARKIDKKYVPRNSFILNNEVGIGYSFPNKSFTTDNPSSDAANMDAWGIFIFNNNCGIKPGTRIEELFPEMLDRIITNEDGDEIGIKIYLRDIESKLTNRYGLSDEDFLFLFDFTCSIMNEETNPRLIRVLSRQIPKIFGFHKETGKKRKGNRGGKKKTQKTQKIMIGQN
jgi:hypothetical protein